MFEEDYERCFICEQPCKGLYCSSECRLQDKGVQEKGIASPNARPAGIRLTSQIPIHLSPLVHPANHHSIGPSPGMPPSNADSSSSSSITSSPIQSPRTNPSGSDSPQKESFDLPPLAYPSNTPSSLAFSGSIPVRIPALLPKASPSHTPGSHTPASMASTVYPAGASIDTLVFGRKPGLVNSVTSPNALIPRCACGKPANHRGRAVSKDRAMDSGFSTLSLGPSVTSAQPHRTQRIVSASAASSNKAVLNGFTTPQYLLDNNASYLSRSRSDPIPPLPLDQLNTISAHAPRLTTSRRPSHLAEPAGPAVTTTDLGPGGGAPASVSRQPVSPSAPPLAVSPRRGRSRERQSHPVEPEVPGLLNHPPEREHPPSRSRPRREDRAERRRSDEERERPRVQPPAEAQITPSWSRRTSPRESPEPTGAGVVPAMRRTASGTPSGGQKSPVVEEKQSEKEAEMRRASAQLGAIYGVAAG